jgi:hypothetical protein
MKTWQKLVIGYLIFAPVYAIVTGKTIWGRNVDDFGGFRLGK